MKKARFKEIEVAYEKAAEDQICNICLKKMKLTWDHVPPKGAAGNHAVVIDSLVSRIINQQPFRQNIVSQNGVKFKTLCAMCNGRLRFGDHFLKIFAERVRRIVESRLYLVRPIKLDFEPQIILRSILGHLVAAKVKTDQCVFDQNLRPCLMDFSIPIPDNVHIYFWIYPFRTIRIMRDFTMPSVRGQYNSFSMFQFLKFYPLSFLISDNSNYYELFSLDIYKNIPLEQSIEIVLPIDRVYKEDWPENEEGGNIILFGSAGMESVFAQRK